MIKIERLRFRHVWSMTTRSIQECQHVRTNKCVRTNICRTSVFVVSVTLSTAMNLVHRNSFPKLSNFPWYFTQFGQFRGEANDEKYADPGKKNRNSRKSSVNSRNLLETFRRSRKEENLYGHCDMNNGRRILSKGSTTLRGCWFLVEKASFSKEFRSEFHSGGGGQ